MNDAEDIGWCVWNARGARGFHLTVMKLMKEGTYCSFTGQFKYKADKKPFFIEKIEEGAKVSASQKV